MSLPYDPRIKVESLLVPLEWAGEFASEGDILSLAWMSEDEGNEWIQGGFLPPKGVWPGAVTPDTVIWLQSVNALPLKPNELYGVRKGSPLLKNTYRSIDYRSPGRGILIHRFTLEGYTDMMLNTIRKYIIQNSSKWKENPPKANPWAICRSMQNKYGWSDAKTER